MMDNTLQTTMRSARRLCPFIKRTPSIQLRGMVRQHHSAPNSGSLLVERAEECPYMSQQLSLIHI